MSGAEWNAARRILCVRLDSLGDVLMTAPAIRALRESAPGRRISLLTSPAGARAAALVPEVDDLLVYEAPWMKPPPVSPGGAADLALIEQIRRAGPDAAVIFTVYSQSPLPAALFCYLAGVPRRLAYCRENPYHLLTDWAPETEPQAGIRHEVQRQLDLVAAVGARTGEPRLRIRVPPGARARINALLRRWDVAPGRRLAVVHPGASAPSRRYPPASFAEVVRGLRSALGCEVVLTGTGEEAELGAQIARRAGVSCRQTAGRLSLADLAALLERASLLVSNNTGPVHVAAASGTPVVVLYALTNPQHTPWAVPARVLSYDVPCRYCYKSICPAGHHDCLARVTPEEVLAAADALLRGGRETRGKMGMPAARAAAAGARNDSMGGVL